MRFRCAGKIAGNKADCIIAVCHFLLYLYGQLSKVCGVKSWKDGKAASYGKTRNPLTSLKILRHVCREPCTFRDWCVEKLVRTHPPEIDLKQNVARQRKFPRGLDTRSVEFESMTNAYFQEGNFIMK